MDKTSLHNNADRKIQIFLNVKCEKEANKKRNTNDRQNKEMKASVLINYLNSKFSVELNRIKLINNLLHKELFQQW